MIIIYDIGDALLVLFTDKSSYDHTNTDTSSLPFASTPSNPALAHLVHKAAYCAQQIHAEFRNYSPKPGITLNLHTAISCGTVHCVIVGNNGDSTTASSNTVSPPEPLSPLSVFSSASPIHHNNESSSPPATFHTSTSTHFTTTDTARWEFIIKGTPVHDLGIAMSTAQANDIILTKSAYDLIHDVVFAIPVALAAIARASTTPVVNNALQSPSPPITSHSANASPLSPLSGLSARTGRLTLLASTRRISTTVTPQQCMLLQEVLLAPDKRHSKSRSSRSSRSSSTEANRTDNKNAVVADSTDINSAESIDTCEEEERDEVIDVLDETDKQRLNNAISAFILPHVLEKLADHQGEWLAEFRRITTVFIQLPEHDITVADPSQRAHNLQEFCSIVVNSSMLSYLVACISSLLALFF